MPRALRRRDFLAASVLGMGALATVKVGGRWLRGVAEPSQPVPALSHLSARQAATVVAAALVMVGPRAQAAYEAGRWHPAVDTDALMARLAPGQRGQLALAITLFEEWTFGLSGFSSWDRETQVATLARWRTSGLGLQRSVWGFLHASACSSFSGSEAGWEAMDYPGPCVGNARSPGQTAAFEWDEVVP